MEILEDRTVPSAGLAGREFLAHPQGGHAAAFTGSADSGLPQGQERALNGGSSPLASASASGGRGYPLPPAVGPALRGDLGRAVPAPPGLAALPERAGVVNWPTLTIAPTFSTGAVNEGNGAARPVQVAVNALISTAFGSPLSGDRDGLGISVQAGPQKSETAAMDLANRSLTPEGLASLVRDSADREVLRQLPGALADGTGLRSTTGRQPLDAAEWSVLGAFLEKGPQALAESSTYLAARAAALGQQATTAAVRGQEPSYVVTGLLFALGCGGSDRSGSSFERKGTPQRPSRLQPTHR